MKSSVTITNNVKNNLVLLFSVFIFLILALYNGFPVMSGDDIVYLQSAFEGKAAAERPIFYGLFVRLSSLGVSVWFTMFVQSLIVAYLIQELIKNILGKISNLHIIALMTIVSLGTISSYYVGQLMPDIFTPILGLSLFHFVYIKASRLTTTLVVFIIVLSTLCHFSHQIILTLIAFSLFGISLIFKSLRLQLLRKSFYLLAVSIFCWFTLMTSNYLSGRGFVTSSASHVFLMGKLCESGVLKTYLDKACPTKNYKICAYKDSLPPVAWGFVWDQNFNSYYKTGSWNDDKEEYESIMSDIFSRPKYWAFMAFKSVEATARQVILTNIDEGEERSWVKFEKGDQLYMEMEKHFPHELNEFLNSRQNTKTLHLVFYDDVYIIILILSSLIVLFGMNETMKRKALPVYAFFIFYIIANAFATATFGNVLTRLNSRNIWLLPLVNILYSYQIFIARLKQTV